MAGDGGTASSALGRAEYLEQRGEYVEALRAITGALLEDPSNEELARKYQELQAIICWRC
ncbi:MAG: hypothetical protein JW839_22335 [Candidatus Lokiarchaeota archaeon]|nr:hypothetical protein [Candidatus Lokiarchaeota archaeon]